MATLASRLENGFSSKIFRERTGQFSLRGVFLSPVQPGANLTSQLTLKDSENSWVHHCCSSSHHGKNCSWLWILQILVFWRGLARMYSSLIFRMFFWTALRALRVPLWWKFLNLWTQALFISRSLWHYTGAVAHAMRGLLKHHVNLKVGGKNMLIKNPSCQTWTMTYHVHLAYGISGPSRSVSVSQVLPPSPTSLPQKLLRPR